jgi:outer membrane protein, heavy metal efflux system
MHSLFSRPRPSGFAIPLLALATFASAAAQTPPAPSAQATSELNEPLQATAVDLASLFDSAWRQHPLMQTASVRALETQAKLARAGSWLAAPPTVGAGLRTDAITPNARREGLREIEFEVELPLASAARRTMQAESARAEGVALNASVEVQRWQLAGEVREAFAKLRLAEGDLALAQTDFARSEALAQDTSRRTRAGDVARVDELQANANRAQAQIVLIKAQIDRDSAARALAKLAGLPSAASAPRFALGGSERLASDGSLRTNHPLLVQAERAVDAVRAKLNEVSKLSADAPAINFQLANERTKLGGSRSTARVGFSMAFDEMGQHHFRAPASAQARRELAEAESQRVATQRAIEADARIAEAELAAARARLVPANERAKLAVLAAELYEKAFRLGELDLPTRLRVEGERASAQRAAQQAAADVDLAVSRLNQALGLLP